MMFFLICIVCFLWSVRRCVWTDSAGRFSIQPTRRAGSGQRWTKNVSTCKLQKRHLTCLAGQVTKQGGVSAHCVWTDANTTIAFTGTKRSLVNMHNMVLHLYVLLSLRSTFAKITMHFSSLMPQVNPRLILLLALPWRCPTMQSVMYSSRYSNVVWTQNDTRVSGQSKPVQVWKHAKWAS